MFIHQLKNHWIIVIIMSVSALFVTPGRADTQQAGQVLEAAGIRGGLIVHIGCGQGKLTSALRANDSYVVHGLDSKPGNVAAARRYIKSLGQYGSVSV
ncbi:MAG: methyltransferase domain-containing protein, partial [Planctomycetota bacterium]